MIGFIRVSEIPRLLLSLVLSAAALGCVVAAIEHFQIKGNPAAALFVGALAVFGMLGYWVAGRICEWVRHRFS